ncbi:hypothetical protein G7046_g6218 [Stylonectria norvegica]|nr:hypothetical protein G7046_g6218 [Stylonectria norvegica]
MALVASLSAEYTTCGSELRTWYSKTTIYIRSVIDECTAVDALLVVLPLCTTGFQRGNANGTAATTFGVTETASTSAITTAASATATATATNAAGRNRGTSVVVMITGAAVVALSKHYQSPSSSLHCDGIQYASSITCHDDDDDPASDHHGPITTAESRAVPAAPRMTRLDKVQGALPDQLADDETWRSRVWGNDALAASIGRRLSSVFVMLMYSYWHSYPARNCCLVPADPIHVDAEMAVHLLHPANDAVSNCDEASVPIICSASS